MSKRIHWAGHIAVLAALVMVLCTVLTAVAATNKGVLSSTEIGEIINTTTDSSLITSPFISVANTAKQSVVGVNNYQQVSSYNNYFGYGGRQQRTTQEQLAGTGSGVVVTKYGHILTNFHVVEDASRVTVTSGEDEWEATVVGTDETLDIAVLYVPKCTLAPVVLGDSDQLQVGEWAIVIGNPLGTELERSMTVGVVSALDRSVTDTTTDRYGRRTTINNQMIQVDAAINSGNSGGGMFNVLGQLQGIPARRMESSTLLTGRTVDNIGMCIPINVAKPLLQSVLEDYAGITVASENGSGSASSATSPVGNDSPRMGVSVQTLSSTNSAVQTGVLPRGAWVMEVEDDSPAKEAGMQTYDIIVEVDGTVISSSTDLTSLIATHKEGDVLKVKVYRAQGIAEAEYVSDIGDGEYIDLSVELRVIGAKAL